MRIVLAVILTCALAFAFCACGPKRQPDPDYEKVRQNAEEANQDLADEEDQRQD
jgi:hypothetical protein